MHHSNTEQLTGGPYLVARLGPRNPAMPRLTLALCAVSTALSPLKVCHHKTCSKNGLAKRTLDIAHVLGGPETAVPTAACQSGCNAGTVSVVGRRLYDVERASAATSVCTCGAWTRRCEPKQNKIKKVV